PLLLRPRLLEHHRPRRSDLATALAGDEGIDPAMQRLRRPRFQPRPGRLPRLGVDTSRADAGGPLRAQERDPARDRRGQGAEPPERPARRGLARGPAPAAAALAAPAVPALRLAEPSALLRLRLLPGGAPEDAPLPGGRRHAQAPARLPRVRAHAPGAVR